MCLSLQDYHKKSYRIQLETRHQSIEKCETLSQLPCWVHIPYSGKVCPVTQKDVRKTNQQEALQIVETEKDTILYKIILTENR